MTLGLSFDLAPSSEQLRTITATEAANAHFLNANPDPRLLEFYDRSYDGMRKAGLPEG